MVEKPVDILIVLCAVVLSVFSSAAAQDRSNSTGGGPKITHGIDLPPDKFFLDKIFNKYGDEGFISFEVSV